MGFFAHLTALYGLTYSSVFTELFTPSLVVTHPVLNLPPILKYFVNVSCICVCFSILILSQFGNLCFLENHFVKSLKYIAIDLYTVTTEFPSFLSFFISSLKFLSKYYIHTV